MKKNTAPRTHEQKLWKQGFTLVAGVDEAGRGAWAGPIAAAAVILPANKTIRGITDSKRLTPKKREQLYERITKNAVTWAVALLDHTAIDSIGIQEANRRVMAMAIERLRTRPKVVLSDGLHILTTNTPSQAIIRGDSRVYVIAAASIVAKVTRDRLMVKYHGAYPAYEFHRHKGYGTKRHLKLLRANGVSPIHRKSFAPIRKRLQVKHKRM